jgi:hypothetical protein
MADRLDEVIREITVEGITIRVIVGSDGFSNPVDVSVRTPSGEKYVCTFFTFQHIDVIRQAHAASGENLGGTYFWATDSILVRELDENIIGSVVLDLWRDGQLPAAMTQVDTEEDPAQ